jgi:signal transduction histidine kinase
MHWIVVGPLYPIFILGWSVSLVASFTILIRAYRDFSAVKRNQALYFGLSAGIGFAGGSLCYLPNFGIDVYPIGNFFACLYPLMMSIAIVKHQLMDVTIFIRKTVVYSIVTAVLTGIYFAILLLITRTLQGFVGTPGTYSSLAAAGAIAVLFNPLRVKIQNWVDRRFPRESLDQRLLRETTSRFVHEIKRPLSNISLPAQLVKQDLQRLAEGKAEAVEVLPQVLERLEFIIRESVDAGQKMEALQELASGRRLIKELVSLDAILNRVIEAEQPRTARMSVRLDVERSANDVQVKGNARQLEMAIQNIVKNATDAVANQEEGCRSIVIRTAQRATDVRISIRDSGSGIASQDLARIFEAYFTTKGSQGSGVGLYLSREILRAHGGNVTAESHVGEGATFVITLPVANPT